MGPATRLISELGIAGEADLDWACRTNRVRDVLDDGGLVQKTLQRALRTAPWGTDARRLPHARRVAARVLDRLQRDESALRLAVAGAVRRMAPTVDRVVLLATAHEPAALLDAFRNMPFVSACVESATDHAAVRTDDGTRVELTVTDEATFFSKLLELTGPAAHVERVRAHANAVGRSLDVAAFHEPELYAALELPYCPPELRERSDLEEAPDGWLHMRDVNGLAHVHTAAAAGSFSVAEMADRAAQEGFAWMVVADRGPNAQPRGLSTEGFGAQADEIRAANAREPVEGEPDLHVFHGLETDFARQDAPDVPPAQLDAADVVFATVEPGRGDPAGDAAALTRTLVAAATHPAVHVLGHLKTPGAGGPTATPDWSRVFEACEAHGTAVELSGEAHAVSYDAGWHDAARAAGVSLVPAADAHDLESVDNLLCAVGAARRGAWTVSEVLPTLDVAGFAAWCRREGNA